MTEPYYSDPWVSLFLGDCLEVRDWLAADVLCTDPPYGVAWMSGQFSRARVPLEVDIAGDGDVAVRDAMLALWGNRPALVFGTWKQPRPSATTNRLIWYKAATKPGMRTQPWIAADEEIYQLGHGFGGPPRQNVYVTSRPQDGASGEVATVGHPTPKPLALMSALIAKCPPGVIADPFAGSGSTLVAAKALGRKAIGVELDERYAEIAARRLAQDVLDFGEPA